MKKIVLCFIIVLVATSAKCQKLESGSLEELRNEKVNFVVDFSKAEIDLLSEEDFLKKKCLVEDEGEKWRDYWYGECADLFISRFSAECNKKCANLIVSGRCPTMGKFPDARYTAIYRLQEVDADGELDGKIEIVDKQTNQIVATIKKVHGDGRHWGSIENLISDGMDDAGERIGRFFKKKFK